MVDRGDYVRTRQRLMRDLAALPAGTPVRLAKRTSNLFRSRTGGAARLDVDGLSGVLEIDPQARTADVLGMTTYEELVDATLAVGLVPLVVPQLRTITLGGAVTGLGIEASSFRAGMPHESVREIEVLTGDGRIVTARPDNEHRDLFFGFPNSYGTLGYALRLVIELEPVRPYVELRHERFRTAEDLARRLREVCAPVTAPVGGAQPDFVDGTWFGPDECYLTLGRYVDQAPGGVSDYTGRQIYYRSIAQRTSDVLTVHDYLWRWDTDWFWCSRAFGVQRPAVRALVPRRLLRSDTYYRLVAFERRHRWKTRWDRRRGRTRARGGGAGRRGAGRRARGVPRRVRPAGADRAGLVVPAAPARARGGVAAVLLRPGHAVRQRRLLVERAAGAGRGPAQLRPVRRGAGGPPRWPQVALLDELLQPGGVRGGVRRPRLRRAEEDLRRGRAAARPVRQVRGAPMTVPRQGEHRSGGPARSGVAQVLSSVVPGVRFRAYDGSVGGDGPVGIDVRSRRALAHLVSAPGELGFARAYVSGEMDLHVPPGGPSHLDALRVLQRRKTADLTPAERLRVLRTLGLQALVPVAPPPQEVGARRLLSGLLAHTRGRDAVAIAHHYDVSNRFYGWVLGPSMAYTCAVYPHEGASLDEAQAEKFDLVCRKLALQPGQRLLDVGCGWGGMVRHAARHYGVRALGVTLSRSQAEWAQKAIAEEGPRRPRRGAARRLPRRRGDRLRRGQLDRADRAHRRGPDPVVRGPARRAAAAGRPAAQPLHHPGAARTCPRSPGAASSRATSSLTASCRASARWGGALERAGLELRHGENLREHYARTCRAWADNLDAHWDEAVAEVGLGTARVWALYLAGSSLAFERGEIQLHQVLAVLPDDGRSGFELRPDVLGPPQRGRGRRPACRAASPARSALAGLDGPPARP